MRVATRAVEKVERPELLSASNEMIEDAVGFADVLLLRGLIYQLTGDPELAATKTRPAQISTSEIMVPASDDDIALIRRKAVDFLKAYRDAGAGPIDLGPSDRLAKSLDLIRAAISEHSRDVPDFLSRSDSQIPEGIIGRLPAPDDVSIPVQTQLIVELCSR